ncbi:MAG: twin-arginine translocase TatA/TatE family subunit [Pseudomonadaceae bacterium]|nr:twin-arginine translocase TatA/TatE family subunit [Pseudomonadaceae bacterium]
MFGLGFTEILVILVLVLILFGAGKLPEVMGDLGKGLKSFKDEMDGKGDDALKAKSATNASAKKKTPVKKAKPAAKKKPAKRKTK